MGSVPPMQVQAIERAATENPQEQQTTTLAAIMAAAMQATTVQPPTYKLLSQKVAITVHAHTKSNWYTWLITATTFYNRSCDCQN